MKSNAVGHRLITVSVKITAGETVFQVSDNGMGITEENLSRIFQHGFTTRQDGHGFGLHSGANNARQLGGTLSALSGGLGHGAQLTLRLPLKSDRLTEIPINRNSASRSPIAAASPATSKSLPAS